MLSIDHQALDWALLKVERELDPAEQAAFDDWYASDVRHQGAFLRAMAIQNALTRTTVQENLKPTKGALLAQTEDVDPLPGSVATRWNARRSLLALGGLAAGVAVLATRPWLAAPQPGLVVATAKGEFRKMPLADHSVVNINSASRIEVQLSARSRDIALHQGEVWFEVAKDKARPFIVTAGGVRVRAVGTAFGIRRYGNGSEILVSEGRVAVWTDALAGEPGSLAAGDRAFVSDQATDLKVEHRPQEVERRLAWREGRIIFMNQSLKEAVADFNRYSRKTLVISDRSLEQRKLVGQYQIDAPERFARDVGAFLRVPVSVTAREIRIGRSE